MEFSNLLSGKLTSQTIRIPCAISPANRLIRPLSLDQYVILDTGATTTSITSEALAGHGYGRFTVSSEKKLTATEPTSFQTCKIQGLKLANAFEFPAIAVDVLQGWGMRSVMGVVGMDILTQLTFIMSHPQKKYLLTDKPIPELFRYFATMSAF